MFTNAGGSVTGTGGAPGTVNPAEHMRRLAQLQRDSWLRGMVSCIIRKRVSMRVLTTALIFHAAEHIAVPRGARAGELQRVCALLAQSEALSTMDEESRRRGQVGEREACAAGSGTRGQAFAAGTYIVRFIPSLVLHCCNPDIEIYSPRAPQRNAAISTSKSASCEVVRATRLRSMACTTRCRRKDARVGRLAIARAESQHLLVRRLLAYSFFTG